MIDEKERLEIAVRMAVGILAKDDAPMLSASDTAKYAFIMADALIDEYENNRREK